MTWKAKVVLGTLSYWERLTTEVRGMGKHSWRPEICGVNSSDSGCTKERRSESLRLKYMPLLTCLFSSLVVSQDESFSSPLPTAHTHPRDGLTSRPAANRQYSIQGLAWAVATDKPHRQGRDVPKTGDVPPESVLNHHKQQSDCTPSLRFPPSLRQTICRSAEAFEWLVQQTRALLRSFYTLKTCLCNLFWPIWSLILNFEFKSNFENSKFVYSKFWLWLSSAMFDIRASILECFIVSQSSHMALLDLQISSVRWIWWPRELAMRFLKTFVTMD